MHAEAQQKCRRDRAPGAAHAAEIAKIQRAAEQENRLCR